MSETWDLPMDILLNDIETRVLGALMEKEITTPDYYPLSLNALINACNQKSSRYPVMELGEDEVRKALDSLAQKRLAGPVSSADSRVAKFEHRLPEVFNFDRREAAVLCVLLLRGAQTPGELRGRTERMYRFEELADVQSTLQRLMQRDPPLVKMFRRQPGTKEARCGHLFSGDVQEAEPAMTHETAPVNATAGERIARLEAEVALLNQKIADMEQQLANFRKQFE
jgi:uncharacterized protein YceH (UPF0502 family)